MSEIEYVDGWPQPYRMMDAAPYWEALQREELTYQHCTGCDHPVWPAHSLCPDCGQPSLVWKRSGGRGKVYSHSTVMRGPTPTWQSIVPYTVGFVEMDEGYFIFTQIDAPAEDIAIDRAVEVRFVRRGDQTLPVFALAD